MPKNFGKLSLEEITQVFDILNECRKQKDYLSPISIARYIDSSDYESLEAKKLKGKYFILNLDGENKTVIDENTGRTLILDSSGIFYQNKSKREMPLNYEKALQYLASQGYEFLTK